jgi:hypothetical protein
LAGGWTEAPISGGSAGDVLTLDANMQPTWQPLPEPPSGLPPTTAVAGRWVVGMPSQTPTGVADVRDGSAAITHVDADGVDHTAWLHALAPDDIIIFTVAGHDYPMTVGAIYLDGDRPTNDYMEFKDYRNNPVPLVVQQASEWLIRPGGGPQDGDVLTLDNGQPAWLPAPSGMPDPVSAPWDAARYQWVGSGFARLNQAGTDSTSAPTELRIEQQTLDGLNYHFETMEAGGTVAMTDGTHSSVFTVTGPVSFANFITTAPGTWTGDALSSFTVGRNVTLTYTPPAPTDGVVLTLEGGQPVWAPPASKAKRFTLVTNLPNQVPTRLSHNFGDRWVDVRVYDSMYKEVSAEIVLFDDNRIDVAVSQPGTYYVTVNCPGYVPA